MTKLSERLKQVTQCIRFKYQVIYALIILMIMAVLGVSFCMIYNFRNTPVQEHTRQINSDVVNITITGTSNQRTIKITKLDTQQTMTLTSRRVLRRRTNAPPLAPRQNFIHRGDVLEIYSVGNNILVIHEVQSNVRHYI